MTTDVRVEIGFDLGASPGPTVFVLGDPVQGELDSEFVLAGELFYDVTDAVRSVSVRRGRSRRLDKSQTGSAAVTLDNRLRTFDPLYSAGPYFGQIKPRRPIRISVSGQAVFTGLIEDWNLDYDLSGDSIASVSCVDGFVLLAGAEFTAHTAVAELSSERVASVLSRPEVAWPAGLRDIATGSQALQADVVDGGTNVLNYLQLVEETEVGSVFVAADGVLTFKGANTPSAAIQDVVLTDNFDPPTNYNAGVSYVAALPYVGPAAADILVPYEGVAVEYGTETLFNRVIVSRVNGGTAVADDEASRAEYGVSVLDRSGQLSADDAQVSAVADYLLSRYKQPEVRVREMTVNLLATQSIPQVAAIEIGNLLRTRYTPNGVGAGIEQLALVEGVAHASTPNSHRVTFALDPVTALPFELDNPTWGVLDLSILGL